MMSLPSASWTSMVDSRREQMRVAVEMRAEQHALFGDLAQAVQTEDLESAGIGEDRPRPGHELVQSAEPADGFVPGTQIEMIGVAENDLRVEIVEQSRGEECL